ncbi:Fe-S cluster assembly protein SufD [bacterium]|nr:Fe-S cluster assembly protein SufD [bacterium]MBP9806976.1 Fe-S cluster assembly protein SufD [bacterium]
METVMAELKLAKTIAKERVADLAQRNGEPSWLQDSRNAAWEIYFQSPMPTTRDDDWRKTEIDNLDLSTFITVDPLKNKAAKAPAMEILQSALAKLSEPAGIFVDDYESQTQYATIKPELAKQGVIFLPLVEAIEKHPDLVKKIFESGKPLTSDDKFTLMNKALFNSGLLLYVPKNVVVDGPFVSAVNLPVGTGGQAVFPRVVVVAEANSHVTLVSAFANAESADAADKSVTGTTLSNSFIEITVGQGAKVTVMAVDKLSNAVFAVSCVRTHIHKDGVFNLTTAGLGGRQIKSDIETIMVEPGSHSDIRGVVLGDGSEHFSYNTIQEHTCPDTTSNINFRVALKETSSSVYQGIVKVDKIAQRTNAFQSNKNLLLGTEARADSIPRLEILADDVKCSHGATVGPVDKEQLFYLNCRGLNLKEAEELIVRGFFVQILDDIEIKGAADWVGDLVAEKIYK